MTKNLLILFSIILCLMTSNSALAQDAGELDYSALQDKVDEATPLLQDNMWNIGPNVGNYTMECFNILADARVDAMNMIQAKSATSQQEIDDMLARLQAAIDQFVPNVEATDYSRLDSLNNVAIIIIDNNIGNWGDEPGQINKEAYDNLVKISDKATEMLNNESAKSQQDIDGLADDLEAAIAACEPNPSIPYTVSPAKGEELQDLTYFTITFDETVTNIQIANGAQAILYRGEEFVKNSTLQIAENQIVANFSGLELEGAEYSIIVAAHSFSYDGGETWSDEVKTTFTVLGPVNKDDLENAINEARAMLNDITIGDEPGQYSQAVVSALNSAISEADDVLFSAETQKEVDDALAMLTEAMNNFKPNKKVIFEEGKQYVLRHQNSGLYLAFIDGNDAQDGHPTAASLQEKGTPLTAYNATTGFILANGDNYLGISSAVAWNAATNVQTVWRFEETTVEGEYNIYQLAENKGLGVDNTSAGSGIYTDKAGQIWTVEEATNENSTVGISTLVNKRQDNVIFDLQGRQVNALRRGLFIKNGVKILMK